MLLMASTLLPLILLWPTWRFYRKEGDVLASWRRIVFLIGMVVNAVSGAVLLSFTIHAYVASRGTTPVDLDRMYPGLTMLGLGFLAAGLAFFGRSVSRTMLVCNGLLTAVLWYRVALAASP